MPEHHTPWKKQEERMIKNIDTKDEIINFPDRKPENITPQEKIWALQAEIERLGGVGVEEVKKLNELLKIEEEKLHKEKFKTIKNWKTFKR